MKDVLAALLPVPKAGRLTGGTCAWDGAAEERATVKGLGAEAYRLAVTPRGVRLEAGGPAGFLRAGQTLAQLRILAPRVCPCLEIADEPDFRVRGYMLDISRCKVPCMEHLFRLVDLLALFKFNHLQLYTEHTFAYAGHETVWAEASPMTPDQVRELDAYCGARGIELVPNQNAFGHMERWLRHDAYHYLAESPYGFQHPVAGWKPHGTVLYPDEHAIAFVDGLLSQLLPCFRSGWVHLGCDEPWELGQGRSEERVAHEGRHAVFLDHVLQLHRLAQSRGKRMLFWSDELRADPARIREFPRDIIPVAWGYEADHDFAPECRAFAAAGYDFLVAPGDSSWKSFSGRLETASANIRRAVESARASEAAGLLLASWGDQGHQQVWPAQLPALALFAAQAWNAAAAPAAPAAALNRYVFRDDSGDLGAFWDRLARIDAHIPVKLNSANSSFPYDALYAAKGPLRHALRPLARDGLFHVASLLDDLDKQLARADPTCDDAGWLLEESRLALEMTRFGVRRADAVLRGHDPDEALRGWEACIAEFKRVWLHRSRVGGLAESIGRLQAVSSPG